MDSKSNYNLDSKGDILANLYSLRAGLSVIASEKEKTEDIQSDAESKIGLFNTRAALLERSKKEYLKNIEKENDKRERTKQIVDNGMPSRSKWILTHISSLLFGIIASVAIVGAVGFLIWFLFIYWRSMDLIFAVVLVVAAIVGAYIVIRYLYKHFIRGRILRLRVYRLRKQEYLDAKECLSQMDNETLDSLQKSIEKCEKEMSAIPTQINDVQCEKEKSLTACFNKGSLLYRALQTQYAPMLDERDWGELDLVIYAFETGRADNIKEALQFVDGEKRANRILNAIEVSSSQICTTIQGGLRSLASGMVKCFQVLSQQIADNAAKQAAYISSLENRVDMLTDKIDYQNALMKQRNVSSQKLVEENQAFLSQAKAMLDAKAVQMRNNGGRV